jgi:small subunit ribosomal protein S19
MAKKIFTYRGKTLEELKQMDMQQLSNLLPSRQRRKITRGFSDQEKKFIEKITLKDNVKTHLRDMLVLPVMVGKTIKIHNGQKYEAVTIQPESIGNYFGELSLSRKRTLHSNPGVGATKSSAHTSAR